MESQVQSSDTPVVQNTRGYCETIESIGACLRTYVSENVAIELGQGRTTSNREAAHANGELLSPLNGLQPIFALLGYDDLRTLEGRLLTIIDASYPNDRQCRAVKDLVRNAIWFDWVPNLDTDDPSHGKPDLSR